MRTVFYKGYKYEISEGLITMREVDLSTSTRRGSDVVKAIKELIGEIPNRTIVMLHVMRYSRWYNIYRNRYGTNVSSLKYTDIIGSIKFSIPYKSNRKIA